MNFITIGQYFNKLQSVLLLLLITPLLVFITLFFLGTQTPQQPRTEYFIVLPAIVFCDWLLVVILFNKKIKSVRKEQGLGIKLDQYFRLTIIRFSLLSSGSMVMAVGLYLTRSDIFTGIFIGGLAFSAILWPSARKVSNDLLLKGAEREMVYLKKDTL